MKTYNYTNWKNYLIHLLNEKKISDSESVESFLNTASQMRESRKIPGVYIALDKGDLIDEREQKNSIKDFFSPRDFCLYETSRRKK